MFAKLLTFCSFLFYIGCFKLLATDAVTGCKLESTAKDIFTIVGKTTKLEWKFEVDVANNPNAGLQLQQPHYGALFVVVIKTNRLFPGDQLKMKPFSNHITWTGNLSDNTASFVFSNVTHNLSLPYNLNLLNCGSGQITRTVILHVIDPPTFKVSNSHNEKVIKEGDTLTEVCSTVGELPMTVQWLKDDVLVTQGINSSTLIINNTNRVDSGIYTCKATHKLVTIQRWLNVSVHYPALIKRFGSSKEKSYVGQSVTLNCSFEGNPKPTNGWITQNPRRTYISSLKDGVSVLRVVFNSSTDFGNYTCFVKNAIGSDNRTIRITQLFSPGKVYFWKNHTTAHAVILWWNRTRDNGGSLVTKYEIAIHEGSKHIDTKETNNTRIDINNLVIKTSYTFCIRARNVVGFGDENCINITTLSIGPPERPKINVVLLNNKNTVRVTWTKVGGEDVIYVLRYREKGANKWDNTLSDLSVLTYDIKNLKYGFTYEIEISAKNSYGGSPSSPLEEITIPKQAHTAKPPTTASVPVTTVPVDQTPAEKEQSNGNKTTVIIISVLAVILVIVAILFFVLWFKRRSVRDEDAPPGEVDNGAGPLDGDEYAVVKYTKKDSKKTNDVVYAELSEIAPVRGEVKHPSYEPTDYADIAHILTPNADLVYSNVQPPCAEEGAYANVEEMEKNV